MLKRIIFVFGLVAIAASAATAEQVNRPDRSLTAQIDGIVGNGGVRGMQGGNGN